MIELNRRFEVGKLLGYLNFSDGRPDVKFRRQWFDVVAFLLEQNDPRPWETLGRWFAVACTDLQASGAAAFRDTTQAQHIQTAVFEFVLPLYRKHHEDLLQHQPDMLLFAGSFLLRACEAVLRERSKTPNGTPESHALAAIRSLNDYVGYRPIAVLETRAQTEFYSHEKVCPIPLYINGVGVDPGRFSVLVRPALNLLEKTDPEFCEYACFDLKKLDEISLDPRAVDHFHPVNKRPNVLFGEWDPHRIDGLGYYRRFIVRQPTLEALLSWASTTGPIPVSQSVTNHPFDPEKLFEAAAVLSGTILMGTGVSGSGPTFYDSTVTLESLVKRIARYRDEFYRRLLDQLPGPHGERLRAEAAKLKQPFAGVRQFLNQAIAAERALHLQERRLALLFAAMGYPSAARERAALIPAPSVRIGCEIRLRQTLADFATKHGHPVEAANNLRKAEELLQRGIDCGALMDPWNILGFQGLYPIFVGREDTVRDPRAEELILTMGRQFDRLGQTLAAGTTIGEESLCEELTQSMQSLADWWDRFATSTVSDLPRVVGSERAEAATNVARALALWRQAGKDQADISFWRRHREGFRTPSAFSQVIEALLDTNDFKGSLALLVTWLGESSPELPLLDASASWIRLAFRWLRTVLNSAQDRTVLLRRFFELIESNADEKWLVPQIQKSGVEAVTVEPNEDSSEDSDDNSFSSAYEGMSYRDSTDDGVEGSIADEGPPRYHGDFPLEDAAEGYELRFQFLSAIARMWRMAARPDIWTSQENSNVYALSDWHRTSNSHFTRLIEFIDKLSAVEVPPPGAGVDGVMEYDRRRTMKGHLLDVAVHTAVEMAAATRALASVLTRGQELPAASSPSPASKDWALPPTPPWEEASIRLERAIAQSDPQAARKWMSVFIPLFRDEPLLVYPPADGGPPAAALRAHTALQVLESLLARLPRLGLLRETYQLTKLARTMERNDPPEGRRVSSFDLLFRTAVMGVVDALVGAAEDRGTTGKGPQEDDGEDGPLAPLLRQIAESFHKLWVEHSQSLRLSALEAVLDESEWNELKEFIRNYGGDLFNVRFLSLSNIRGILGQGVGEWLQRLTDPEQSANLPANERDLKLVDALVDKQVDVNKVTRQLEIILQSLVEHYDEYRDYNSTTTQSDYGDNLYILLDFLRLKVSYDRFSWRLKPLVLAHDVLCRRGHDQLAVSWRTFISDKTRGLAVELLSKLAAREAEHGMRLRTVRDRLEERFLHPLQVDQAAARITTAATVAKERASESFAEKPSGRRPEEDPAFVAFLAAIQPLAQSPTGVGLEIPAWLRRLEDELRKFRSGLRSLEERDSLDLLDDPLLPPAPRLEFSDLKRQLNEWEKPLE